MENFAFQKLRKLLKNSNNSIETMKRILFCYEMKILFDGSAYLNNISTEEEKTEYKRNVVNVEGWLEL